MPPNCRSRLANEVFQIGGTTSRERIVTKPAGNRTRRRGVMCHDNGPLTRTFTEFTYYEVSRFHVLPISINRLEPSELASSRI
jgi:hypothetical protein